MYTKCLIWWLAQQTGCHRYHLHHHYSCWHYGHCCHSISFYPRTKTLTSLQWSQTLFDFLRDDENSPTSNHSLLGTDICICSSVRSFCASCSVVFDSLRPHGPQPTRLPCPWGFSRQEFQSGLPSPALAGGFFTSSTTWEASLVAQMIKNLPGMQGIWI